MLILFPHTRILLVRKLCYTSSKTTKQWSRWSEREEALQWTRFQHLQSCSWLVVRSNQFGSKIQIMILKPKTNSQTCFPIEISHVTNGTIFCVCLTLAISVLQSVLKWCRRQHQKMQVKKESQQNRNQWWIWPRDAAKGLLSCYLLLHQKAWGKPDTKVNPLWACKLRSTIEQRDLLYTRTHQATQNGILTELGLLKSGNLMNWWKMIERWDQCWTHSTRTDSLLKTIRWILTPKQNQKDATKDSDKHSVMWRMFMSSTLQASVFMGKNYSDNWHSIKNTEDLTMKQMFDVSEKLVSKQSDEIYGVNTINWEDPWWMYLSLVDEQVISLLHTKVYAFSDSVLYFGKMNENPPSNIAWEDRLTWFKSSPEYRTLDRIDGEPMEFKWNIFPGFTTLQLCHKVQELLLRLSVQPENFTGRIFFMSMFNDIWLGSNGNEKECESNAQLVSLYAKRFGAGQWSFLFLGLGSERKWYSICEDSPQGEWDKNAEKMMLTHAESTHPVFRSTSPLSRGVLKSRGGEKLCADSGTIETVFAQLFL